MAGELLVIGLSHQTAPLEVREQVAVGPDRLPDELAALMKRGCFREALLVSTCNRVEIYASAADPITAGQTGRAHLLERARGTLREEHIYERIGPDAIKHAFRVSSSLDSMVLGEPQILGQVKQAFETASATGTIGVLLDRWFTRAFAVAKRVRTETGIAEGSVGVSSVACELARKIFGGLTGRRTLLVGAGKMGEGAARKLRNMGARLHVVNRSADRAAELAKSCGGEARGFEHLASELVHADVVICSTASSRFVITEELVRDVMRARKRQPLFLIDIAVPRDVDPRVDAIDGVFLYDVDDLQRVAEDNLSTRRSHAQAAEKIVAAEVLLFEQWRRSLKLAPTIVALRDRFRDVVRAELERTIPRLDSLGELEREALDRMAEAMVKKLLHHPVSRLRRAAGESDGELLIAAARQLFELPATSMLELGSEEAREDAGVVPLTPVRGGSGETT